MGVSINIKNREAEALLDELKRRTGKGTTDLLLDLLRRERDRMTDDVESKVARAMEINRHLRERIGTRPMLDPRPFEDLLDYDENGLPT